MTSLKQLGVIALTVGSSTVFAVGVSRAETPVLTAPQREAAEGEAVPVTPETSVNDGEVGSGGERIREEDVNKSPPVPRPDGTEAARAFYDRGYDLYVEGDFYGARVQFERALEADPPLEAYFGLGQVELALGNPCAAVKAFSEFLVVGGGRISPTRRREVEFHVLQLRQGSAADVTCHPENRPGTIVLHCDAPGARTRLDGRDVSRFPGAAHQVSPGRHEVEFYDEEGAWSPITVEMDPGSVQHVQCVARPSFGADSSSSRFTGGQKVALAVTGAGLGFAVATLSHFFWNLGRHEAWKADDERLGVEDGTPREVEEHNDLGNSITKAGNTTVGLGIASGVLTVTGLTLFYFQTQKGDSASPTTSSLSTRIHPSSVSLSWSGEF